MSRERAILIIQALSRLSIITHCNHGAKETVMFHCHIIEQEDIGMMGVWDIMGGMAM